MTCAEFERYCEDWLAGAAPPEFDAHVRACPRCAAAAEEMAATRAWLAAFHREAPEPTPAFWTRLEARLSEADRTAEFWALLALSARRAALTLGVIALAFGLWFWAEPEPSVAAFDAPQTYLTDDSTLPGPTANGQLDRDQVLLTLVARREGRQ